MQLSKDRVVWIGIALAVIAAIAHAQDLPAKSQTPQRDFEKERVELVDAHRDEFYEYGRRVLDECVEPGAPEWTGTYCAGDSWRITVAPRSGIAYSCSTCTALLDLNYGSIREVRPDRLIVDFRFDLDLNRPWLRLGREMDALSAELYFVNWGDRRYLIPATQMISFCNEWNSGSLGTAYFPLLRRVGSWPDREEPPSVPRGIPAEFRAYVLDAPIAAHISSIGDRRNRVDSQSRTWLEIDVTLDAGERRGLLRGMSVWMQDRPNSWFGEVMETHANDCTAAFRCGNCLELGTPVVFPELGGVVSTRMRE